MGQYYMPALSDASEAEKYHETITGWAYSHKFNNGLKLMEHSYVGNNFVETVVAALQKRSQRVVWAGDYADEESDGRNLYDHVHAVHWAPMEIVTEAKPEPYRYLLNLSKREYVDMTKLPVLEWGGGTLSIHPLPLLTADGNGRGGGDFRGENPDVGRWARDFITVKPDATAWPPKDWTEIKPDFSEDD